MAGVPPFGQGWSADLPDHRDLTPATPDVREWISKLRRRRSARSPLPTSVDWREFCPPPTDQGPLRSTSAHAVLGMLGYFERRASGRTFAGSARFQYYTARKLGGITGDNGVGLRTTLKALARFGCPPERHWPSSDPARFDEAPEAFCYGFSRDFADLRYLRLLARGGGDGDLLRRVKAFLAAGFVCVCGATATATIGDQGDLPFPTKLDTPGDGAAYTVVGYDDARRIRSTKGALLVRATRGPQFGEGGYGHLPYRFVAEQLAGDFWTVWKPDWAASGEFEQVGP